VYTPSLKLDGPTPRAGHITQFDSDSDTLYVFGGYNPNQPPMNDFYSYSFGTFLIFFKNFYYFTFYFYFFIFLFLYSYNNYRS